jgi:hypothetical protein
MPTINQFCSAALFGVLNLSAMDLVLAQSNPQWLEPIQNATKDGVLVLRWSISGGDPVTLFRISEVHSGVWQMNFTDQAELRLFRPDTGDYQFWVQSCRSLDDGYPHCGVKSSALEISR